MFDFVYFLRFFGSFLVFTFSQIKLASFKRFDTDLLNRALLIQSCLRMFLQGRNAKILMNEMNEHFYVNRQWHQNQFYEVHQHLIHSFRQKQKPALACCHKFVANRTL